MVCRANIGNTDTAAAISSSSPTTSTFTKTCQNYYYNRLAAKIKDELEAIDYKKKTMAKYQLDDTNNQITYLNKISYSKRNAYLQIGVQELEWYVHGLGNHNQQQQEIQNE